jgi:hypothetical protein
MIGRRGEKAFERQAGPTLDLFLGKPIFRFRLHWRIIAWDGDRKNQMIDHLRRAAKRGMSSQPPRLQN